MKLKNYLCLILCIVLVFGCTPLHANAAGVVDALATDIRFERNGEPIDLETYNIANYGYYKLRDIAALCVGTQKEFSVSWDGDRQMITLNSGGKYQPTESDLRPGNSAGTQTAYTSAATVVINGKAVSLSAYNINGYTYYKLRELCGALNIYVSWNETTRTSGIDTAKNADGTTGVRTELSSETIYANCSSSVFYMEVFDAQGSRLASGSGFFISPDGTAVTNYHVIEDASSAKIKLKSGEIYNVSGVYDYDVENDWAVLQIDGSGFDCLTIGDKSTVVGGARVYSISCPLGLQDTFSDGMVSNANRLQDGVTYIQISVPISHGSSGGALINKYGEVIGICSAGYVDGQNLNLAIPITAIDGYSREKLTALSELFPESGQTTPEKPSRQKLAYNALRAAIAASKTGSDVIDGVSFAYYNEWIDEEIGLWFTDYYDESVIEVCTCYIPLDSNYEWWSFLDLTPDGEIFDYAIQVNEIGSTSPILSGSILVDPAVPDIGYERIEVSRDYDKKAFGSSALEMAAAMLVDSLAYTDIYFDLATDLYDIPSYSVADFGFESN